MEVYRKIKKNMKDYYISIDKKDVSRLVSKVIDLYFKYFFQTLFEHGVVQIRSLHAKFYITSKPISYITASMYKNMLISSVNSNYLFEIKFYYDRLKMYKFKFRTMKRLKYMFQKECLNTELVHNLIDKNEKGIIQKRVERSVRRN